MCIHMFMCTYICIYIYILLYLYTRRPKQVPISLCGIDEVSDASAILIGNVGALYWLLANHDPKWTMGGSAGAATLSAGQWNVLGAPTRGGVQLTSHV